MDVREPTDDERVFVEAVTTAIPDVQDWYLNDPDGTPWAMVSLDIVRDGAHLMLIVHGITVDIPILLRQWRPHPGL